MNWKTWSLLILALVAGSAAAYGIKAIFFVEHTPETTSKTASSGLKEQLLVANGDLSAGTELNALNVRLTLTPEEDAPRDGIFSFNGVTGRKITLDIKDGDPISLYDLEEPEQSEEASTGFVPPGCSVVPIEISSVTKENGNRNYLKTTKLNKMIKKGDSVDIIVVKEAPTKSGPVALPRLATEIVAQNVSVFAATDESRFGSDGATRTSTISALLTSEQLERVREASEEGKIRIVLHSEIGINGGEQPVSVFESAENASAESQRISSLEHPRVVPTTQPFVISINDEAPLGAVDSLSSKSEHSPQANDSVVDTLEKQIPTDDFINNDFTIELDAAMESAANINSEQSNTVVAENSSVYRDSVEFNSAGEENDKEEASSHHSNQIEPGLFRPRDVVDEEVGKRLSTPYERAISEDLTSESSVVESGDLSEKHLSDERQGVSAEINKDSNASHETNVKNVKKYSPFIMASPKQSRK